MQRRYKPNVVYELLIHGIYHYAGCHCVSRDYLLTSCIINCSGNYLARARAKNLITQQEYKECVKLINVWEFDTEEEALAFELIKIQELKEKYGDLCKNRVLSRNNSTKGRSTWNKGLLDPYSEDVHIKMSESRKKYYETHEVWNKGVSCSEETRRKISNARTGQPNCSKGSCWFTNGTINVRRTECPSGFYPGITMKKKKVN